MQREIPNKEIEFKFIRFKELDLIRKCDPDLYLKANSSLLQSCPDIYDEFPCYFFLHDNKNNIVCSVKAFPDYLFTNNARFPWAWLGALFTDERYRGMGLATILTRECKNVLHQNGIAWGGVFSNDVALKIYRKLGFIMAGYAKRYLFLRSIKPYLNAHLKTKVLSLCLDAFYRIAIKTIYFLFVKKMNSSKKRKIQYAEFSISELKNCNAIFEPNTYHFNEGLERLIWKIEGCNANSENKCRIFLGMDNDSKKYVTYFVLRVKKQQNLTGRRYKGFSIMTLMDFGFYEPIKNEFFSSIIREGINLFWKSEAEIFEVISSSDSLSRAMRRVCMIRVGRGMSFTFTTPNSWPFFHDQKQLEEWHLTHFAGDAFSF